MIDFKIFRASSEELFPNGELNPRLIVEEGCWYLCTDTAELFVGACTETGLTLKRVNDVKTDITIDSEVLNALEAEINAVKASLGDYAKKTDIPSVEGFATEVFVAEQIKAIKIPEVNLDDYAKSADVTAEINVAIAEKADLSHKHDELYDVKGAAEAVKNELLNGAGEAYDTLKELGNLIEANQGAIETLNTLATGKADKDHAHAEYITEAVLEDYALKSDIPKDYLTAIPAEYVTETELAAELKKIEHPTVDLNGYATEEFVTGAINEIKIPDVSEFIKESDLNDYALKSELPDITGKADTKHTHEEYADKEHAHTEYAEVAHTHDEYLTEHQPLDDYAKKSDIPSLDGYAKTTDLFSKSYNDLTDKPEIPSLEGYATEQFVTDAIAEHESVKAITTTVQTIIPTVEKVEAEIVPTVQTLSDTKADKVPFTTSTIVSKSVGGFEVGEDLKDYTIAKLFAKLLGFSAEPGENPEEPEVPDIPTEPEGIVETILSKKEPIYQLMEDGSLMPTEHTVKEYSVENAATSKSDSTTFYHIVKDGVIIESGYEHHTDEQSQMCYTVVLPDTLNVREGGNVLVQTWDTTPPAHWTTAEYVLTDDLDEIEAALGIRPEVPAGYKFWADLSGADYGTSYRFIIKE